MEARASLTLVHRGSSKASPLVVLVDNETHPTDADLSVAGDVAVARLIVADWECDLSPWPAPNLVSTRVPFGGRASHTLTALEDELLGNLCAREGLEPSSRGIMGYSLGGLFALYALVEGTGFVAAASCSGSLWYDGWTDYLRDRTSFAGPRYCFLSVGRKERRAKNPRLKRATEALEDTAATLAALGAEVEVRLEDGGHVTGVAARMERGLAHLASHLVLPCEGNRCESEL